MKKYYVYILAGRNYGPLFIEMTTDMTDRMKSHRAGHLTQTSFRIDQLVHVEIFDNAMDADKRVQALKSSSREWVDALIERQNPEWEDLLTIADQASQRAA